MNDRRTGIVFVAAQIVVLFALLALPSSDDWPTPGWVDVVGFGAVLVGIGVVLVAGRGLGDALTPTPVPRPGVALATDGFYRHVRHPIYSGLLLAVCGWVFRSGSVVILAAGVATWGFFSLKAAWEERRLAATYPDYRAYAERTPRFVPAVWRRPAS